MDSKVLFNIQYGLFVLSSKSDTKDNACIINTVTQVTANPDRISIAVNKSNFTHDLIANSKKFTVSIISKAATFDLFKHFGFQSGKDVDKFSNFNKVERTLNDTLAIREGTNSYISGDVIQQIDVGTHSIFIANVVDMQKFNDIPSASYNFYQKYIKPKPQPVGKNSEGKTIWRCRVCGYEYVGDELPEDFVCPTCKHGVSDFEKVVPEVKKSETLKLAGTKTEKNLREAFAGESQARNKYTYLQLPRKMVMNKLPRFSSKLRRMKKNMQNFGSRRWENSAERKKISFTRRTEKILNGQICMQEWRVKLMRKVFRNLPNSSEALAKLKNITKNATENFCKM